MKQSGELWGIMFLFGKCKFYFIHEILNGIWMISLILECIFKMKAKQPNQEKNDITESNFR